MIHLVIPRVVSPGAHRVTAVVIHRKSEKKKVPGAVDNWPDGGIECNVLFTIDGKGGDVSEELWNRCLTRLEDEMPSQQFNMWIRPLQVTASEDRG